MSYTQTTDLLQGV